MGDWIEGDLRFQFAVPDSAVEKPDTVGTPWPINWKRVDFVVEEDRRYIFVEVKDYGHPAAPLTESGKFMMREHRNNLVDSKLVPKARDTFCVQHLIARADKPIDYVVVLGGLSDIALLPDMQDRLRQRLAQETASPWARPYVRSAVIVPPEAFDRWYSPHSVVRVSQAPR